MAINFFSEDSKETCAIHTKNVNTEILIIYETD